MNPWYEIPIVFAICSFLFILLVFCLVKLLNKKNVNKRSYVITLVCDVIMGIVFVLFLTSHETNFKYNDWKILNSNVNIIEKKYGSFDLGKIKDGEKGKVAYYLYTDNGPIMPDHLKHYYYMEYDEWGVIYEVYEGVQPGG